MGKKSKWEYFGSIYKRYRKADAKEKGRILDEFSRVCSYNRKYAIRKLNGPAPEKNRPRRKGKRGNKYSETVITILALIWEATGYLCSVRLKAALPLWLPWIGKRFEMTAEMQKQLLSISPRQMDRRLQSRKMQARRMIYGRTKPGALLKHMIPIKTEHWNVKSAGYTETDIVSHSGNSGQGIFGYTINQTDILTTWVESRAVLGKGETRIVAGLQEMNQDFPFLIRGINPDNGSEFINYHLLRYCNKNQIQFTRSRPYKKDDNAHIEQKNWTHVRKLIGWGRYDTQPAIDAMNNLYKNELPILMNLFTPSMKLQRKVRVGSKIKRVYDEAKTPLDRVIASGQGNPEKIDRYV
ncbi:transposase family protein, partial [bacterium]|nr:transposase family protein [bacterium]